MKNSNDHILVIRLSAIGDVAISIPLLIALKGQYPDLKISFLSRKFARNFIEQVPGINFIEAEVNGKHKGIAGLIKLSKEIKSHDITKVADIHDVLRSKVIRNLLSFSGKQIKRINKGRKEKKKLVSGKAKYFKPLQSSLERYADVFKKLGYPINLKKDYYLPVLEISSQVRDQLKYSNDKVYVGIAPFAAHESKMYPLEMMLQVIERLALHDNYRVLLFGGGKQETEILSGIADERKNVFNIAGRFTFKEELALISNLSLMISMDSGNGHMAAMYGVKVLSLWGVTHPYVGFAPYAQPASYALLADRNQYPLIPTSIYGKSYPTAYADSMKSISIDSVVNKTVSIIEEKN